MLFWPKLAAQEASNRPMDCPLPIPKSGQKFFFDKKMVQKGLVKISAPQN